MIWLNFFSHIPSLRDSTLYIPEFVVLQGDKLRVIDILSSFWSWAMPSRARVHICVRTCLSSLRSLSGESEDQGQYCMENFGVGSPLYKPSLDWGRLWVVDWAILKQWVEPGIGLTQNKFNFHSLITKIIMSVVNMWKNQFLPFTQTHLNISFTYKQ